MYQYAIFVNCRIYCDKKIASNTVTFMVGQKLKEYTCSVVVMKIYTNSVDQKITILINNFDISLS